MPFLWVLFCWVHVWKWSYHQNGKDKSRALLLKPHWRIIMFRVNFSHVCNRATNKSFWLILGGNRVVNLPSSLVFVYYIHTWSLEQDSFLERKKEDKVVHQFKYICSICSLRRKHDRKVQVVLFKFVVDGHITVWNTRWICLCCTLTSFDAMTSPRGADVYF